MLGWLFGPKAPRCIVCGKRMRLIQTIDVYDRLPEIQTYRCPRCGYTSTVERPRKLKTHPEW
jgi:predicted RNA-binding Zn-ribbon protein involved in translation (DUF1610 family)